MKPTPASRRPLSPSGRRTICSAVALAISLMAVQAHTAPTGGSVVGGAGNITQTGLETTIVQDSDRLAIDWQSFGIAADERVQFIQPGSDAIALNRVLGNDASHIFGQLEANGQVILVNPNGVFFGEGATVNVAGLVASGLDIDPADFLNGELAFSAVKGGAAVINSGLINASTGGSVVLLGKRVSNEGLISAELGSVALAAGQAAVLTFDPQGLIGVRVSKEILQTQLGSNPAVSNSGSIAAASGRVLLTASVSEDVFSQAVNNGGLAGATDVQVHADGSFSLGRGASLVNTGNIDVSSNTTDLFADDAARNGGDVVLLGDSVTHSGQIHADAMTGDGGEVVLASATRTRLAGESLISASAKMDTAGNGGEVSLLGQHVGVTDRSQVKVDGNFHGGSITLGADVDGTSRLRDTGHLVVNRAAQLSAEGILDGGLVNAWAQTSSQVDGSLSVSGDVGGTISLVSNGRLSFDGTTDTTGESDNGELRLAGKNLTVTQSRSLFGLSEAALNRALSSGDVTLEAQGEIMLGGISLVASGETNHSNLNLLAGGRVQLMESEILLRDGDIHLAAGTKGTNTAALILDETALATNGRVNLQSSGDINAEGLSLGLSLNGMVGRSLQGVDAGAGQDINLSFDDDATTEALLSLEAGGDITFTLDAFRPNLAASGRNVSIDSIWGFHSDSISAENLSMSTIGQVEAKANVSGTTRFFGTAEANYSLSGDFNLLTGETGYLSVVTIHEANDLTLGDLLLLDADISITSTGAGATISQAPNTQLTIGSTIMALEADNIALGAAGTSSVSVAEGYFSMTANSVDINGLLDFSGYFEEVLVTADTITYGEFADIRPSEFGETSDDFPDTSGIDKSVDFSGIGIE